MAFTYPVQSAVFAWPQSLRMQDTNHIVWHPTKATSLQRCQRKNTLSHKNMTTQPVFSLKKTQTDVTKVIINCSPSCLQLVCFLFICVGVRMTILHLYCVEVCSSVTLGLVGVVWLRTLLTKIIFFIHCTFKSLLQSSESIEDQCKLHYITLWMINQAAVLLSNKFSQRCWLRLNLLLLQRDGYLPAQHATINTEIYSAVPSEFVFFLTKCCILCTWCDRSMISFFLKCWLKDRNPRVILMSGHWMFITLVIKSALTSVPTVQVTNEGSLIGKGSISLFVPVTESHCSLINH